MDYAALRSRVSNRGRPKPAFLDALIGWGKTASPEIFTRNAHHDVYVNVHHALGPWRGDLHRRAVMLEVMRVLAGFESSWHWRCGRDFSNSSSDTPETMEAGAWQVSANSMHFGTDLRHLIMRRVGSTGGEAFQEAMKRDHILAMEYIARLLRHTVRHNGPVLRHEIDRWLKRDAVDEFLAFLSPTPVAAP